MIVASADKLHNARAILRDFRTHREALWSRFNTDAGKAGTINYYRGLVSAFRDRLDTLEDTRLAGLVGELEEVVASLEREVNHAAVGPRADAGSWSCIRGSLRQSRGLLFRGLQRLDSPVRLAIM